MTEATREGLGLTLANTSVLDLPKYTCSRSLDFEIQDVPSFSSVSRKGDFYYLLHPEHKAQATRAATKYRGFDLDTSARGLRPFRSRGVSNLPTKYELP